jgi:choline monooxygenase
VIFEWFATDPPVDPAHDKSWSSAIAFADEVQTEDVEICELVQRNLGSRVYVRGRYSVKRENGVHHFHSLFAEYMVGAP